MTHMPTQTEPRLTSLSHGGGCGCKIAPGVLSEILKGTNSRDRHTGSKALIRQLIASKGAGIIATHDLELGALEAEANDQIENWAIEVDIKDGQLFFDYKLKRGVSQSFNATLLMQQMGIKV